MDSLHDRYVYKHESKNRWLFMCNEDIEGLGWCIGNNLEEYWYCKIIHLQKTDMKLECNLIFFVPFFSLDSRSTANEPWMAGELLYYNDRTMKASISCE